MSISVRPVNLDRDRDELLAMLQTNLPALPHARRFEWLYRANPDGPAWSWFACQQDHVVGVTSVFPRSMWIGGQLKLCGQVGDFAIAATHRSLGPALMMQRATLQPVNEGALSFCYDCPPHEAGMATFRRLGFQPNVAIRRFALPLRIERQLSKRLGFTPPVVTSLGNVLLRAQNRRRVTSDFDIAEHTGPFGDEFTHLDNSLKNTGSIRTRRSASHLNWRYREDPLQRYRVLTARRRGALTAFLIFTNTKEDVTIVDLYGADLASAGLALLQAVPSYCESFCQSVEGFLSDQSDLVPLFLSTRFRPRPVAAQVVAYARPDTDTAAFLKGSTARWGFSGADIRT
jgi:hypothetical protein